MKNFARQSARFAATAILAIGLLGGTSHASEREYKIGQIEVEAPWARATPGHAKNGAAFMKIENEGMSADRLVGVESPVAARVELHTHINDNGVMKMRPSGPIEIAPHGYTMLQPGSYHVMFIGLNAPLKEGEMFPLTLTFEKAGKLNVQVMVMSVGAGAGMGHGMKHGHGMKKN